MNIEENKKREVIERRILEIYSILEEGMEIKVIESNNLFRTG